MENKKTLTALEYNNIRNHVYSCETNSEYGFTNEEIAELIKSYPNINMDKFNDAMMGNTCALIENKARIYHCDVIKAIVCGLENRNLYQHEFD